VRTARFSISLQQFYLQQNCIPKNQLFLYNHSVVSLYIYMHNLKAMDRKTKRYAQYKNVSINRRQDNRRHVDTSMPLTEQIDRTVA